MLTRLRVEGFKNLLEIDLKFGAFNCMLGSNGAGKSNLFDAIRFLHLLTSRPVPEAVALLRETSGRSPSAASLFTAFGGFRAPRMHFSADMLVQKDVVDDYGAQGTASITSLRYEVTFSLDPDDPDRLALTEERLEPISLGEARKVLAPPFKKAFLESVLSGARRGPAFISTTDDGTIHLHQDGHGGRKVPAARSSRTILSGVNSDFPTALAARREMESWRTLLLEPSSMRAPSLYRDPQFIDERGGHLPGTLTRLMKERGEDVLAEVANRLAELLPEVREIRIEDDERFETMTIVVRGADGVFHPARSLSDGTLRFLVLSTLVADPQATGILCLEEPENGIHPDRIESMLSLLQDLAADLERNVGEDNPLRQVIVNTHSPLVFKHVKSDDQLFMEAVDVIREGHRGSIAKVRVPAGTWRSESGGEPVAPARIQEWKQMTLSYEANAEE